MYSKFEDLFSHSVMTHCTFSPLLSFQTFCLLLRQQATYLFSWMPVVAKTLLHRCHLIEQYKILGGKGRPPSYTCMSSQFPIISKYQFDWRERRSVPPLPTREQGHTHQESQRWLWPRGDSNLLLYLWIMKRKVFCRTTQEPKISEYRLILDTDLILKFYY